MMFPLLFLFRWSIFILFSNRLHLSDVFEFFFRFIRRICRIWNFFWSSRKSPKLKKRTKFFRIRNFVEALAIPCFISARWVSRAGLFMIRRCACQGHTVSCIMYHVSRQGESMRWCICRSWTQDSVCIARIQPTLISQQPNVFSKSHFCWTISQQARKPAPNFLLGAKTSRCRFCSGTTATRAT